MASNDDTTNDFPEDKGNAKSGAGRRLQRETILSPDRHKGALVAALCSLAGVGLGFGLGHASTANSNCAHHEVLVSHRGQEIVIPQTRVRANRVAWLGVQVKNERIEERRLGLGGARVTQVIPGSPAQAIGLQVGDVIRNLDSEQIIGLMGLVDAVRTRNIGQIVEIHWTDIDGNAQQASTPLGAIASSQLMRLRH